MAAGRIVAHEYAVYARWDDGGHVELFPVSGLLPEIPVGTILVLAEPVTHDATYLQPVRVTAVPKPGEALNATVVGERRREQQRDHVRIETAPLAVSLRVIPADDDAEDGAVDRADAKPVECRGQLRDISASGARVVVTEGPISRSAAVAVELTLPDGTHVDLVGDVRWLRGGGEHPIVGIAFRDVPSSLEQRITHWIFRQETHRARRSDGR